MSEIPATLKAIVACQTTREAEGIYSQSVIDGKRAQLVRLHDLKGKGKTFSEAIAMLADELNLCRSALHILPDGRAA